MAKDWVGGNAAVFKTLGASNHKNGERQREDYYATEPAATEWLEFSRKGFADYSGRKKGCDVPETYFS